MNSTFTCPVQGNPDLYGLGIRIALYIQILTALVSGFASDLLKVDDDIGHAVVIFILATGAVLFRMILRREIEAIEVFPILTLLMVQLTACRVPYRRKPATIFVFVGESICLPALSAWFWFHGMDTLPRSCTDDYVVSFVKISIWHWFRKLAKVGTVFSLIPVGLGVLFYTFST
jgi:hypothetical protein